MIRDLLLGLRLAVGGGRMSGQALLRLVMTTFGVALVVAILLPAASIGHLMGERSDREAANTGVVGGPEAGDALLLKHWYVTTREDYVQAKAVAAEGPGAPVPPGLDRIPGPGEVVVSPELMRRLDTDMGRTLLATVPGTVVGEIGKAGLADASDLTLYVGSTADRLAGAQDVARVTSFGGPSKSFALDAGTSLVIAPLVVALLLPLLIFVTTASRMGAAQRERRLAALRLLGVDAQQVRRIAAAESLLGAVAGLVAGVGLFLLLRPLIGRLDFFGTKVFPEDFVPSVTLSAVIALLVPGLAVGAAIFGLRRTIVEPLGVVRQSKPVRRRMWWRWTITGLGAALLALTLPSAPRDNGELIGLLLAAGSAFLLIGVSVLLPWVVEKLVRGIRGGTPALLFAVRRLQLDSGTASRVVSGLVVVLAGTILIQTLFVSVGRTSPEGNDWKPPQQAAAEVWVYEGASPDEVQRLIEQAPGVSRVDVLRQLYMHPAGRMDRSGTSVAVGDCATLATQAAIGDCADGDVFLVGSTEPVPTGPQVFFTYQDGKPRDGEQWTPPSEIRIVPEDQALRYSAGTLLVTPGALGPVTVDGATTVLATGPGDQGALFDRVAAAVSPLAWDASVQPPDEAVTSRVNRQVETFRAVLLTATLFVLAVAALSLLMLSIEQIVERRRPMAAMSAAGVPLSVLVRGTLWQNTIPVLVGVVLAVGAGIGLTLPTLRFSGLDFSIDAGLLATVAAAAVLAVLTVTALTYPLLRQATKLDNLRAE